MEVGSSTSAAPVQAQVAVQKQADKQQEKVVGKILDSIDPNKGGKINVVG